MKKTCIVTGGSSGIGAAICELFVQENFDVYNLDLSVGEHGQSIQCDITNHDEVHKHIREIGNKRGIDVLISNAGIHYSANIENTSEQTLLNLFNINVKGAYSAIQATLPFMKKQHQGSIILMASDQALVAKSNSFAYNLTKSALASMAKTTAIDYAKYNIRANAICPGTIETPLYHKAIDTYCKTSGVDPALVHDEEAKLQPLGRLGKAHEVAHLALFLASENAQFITGSLQVIDGGYTAQ